MPRFLDEVKVGYKLKYFREVVFLKELPKDTLGKVLKEKIKNFFKTEKSKENIPLKDDIKQKSPPDIKTCKKCGWGL